MAKRHNDDQGVFAISIEQAVEYTATRVKPIKPPSIEGSPAQQYIPPSYLQLTSTSQNSGPINSNGQHQPVFSIPPETINPLQLFRRCPTAFPPSPSPRAESPPPSYLRYASIIHPHKIQELRREDPKLYGKVLSRNLNAYKDPVVGPDIRKNPHRSPINRPKTPTRPPPTTSELLSKHDVTAQLFSHRQACAARLLGELEENGWLCWEREYLDIDAIARDFGQDLRDSGAGSDLDEYIKLQNATDARRTAPVTPADRSEGLLGTLDPQLTPSSAPRMVRYTDHDEIEEPESEKDEPSEEEKRMRAIRLAKRDHNKRQALFIADMMIEGARIQRMGI